MKEIRVYFEGDDALRGGFQQLLEPVRQHAALRRVAFRMIAGKSRTEAVKDFCRALSTHRKAHVILLVDAESADDGTLGQRVERLESRDPG